MINKKHLLDSIKEEYPFVSEYFYEMVKDFPEEPEIDFDALWNEYEQKYSCKKTTSCDNCTYPNKLYYTTSCFVDFLKSKHLSAPNPKQLPVKKTWTLKKEYQEALKNFDFSFDRFLSFESEPAARRIKYYDLTETPDYSQVQVGDVVEVYHSLSKSPNYGIVQENSNNVLSIVGKIDNINAFCIHYSHIKSLTILKAAK